jgi:hypothetical protein
VNVFIQIVMAVVSTRVAGSNKLSLNMIVVEAFLVATSVDVLYSALLNVPLSLLVLKLLVLILNGVTTARVLLLARLLATQSLISAESVI